MSMLHIIILISITDTVKFIDFYAKFARNVNIIFLILANLALILGLTMSLVYRQKSKEKMFNLDNERAAFRAQYTVMIVITFILSIGWAILFALPYFTIKLHYMDPELITGDDVN